MRKLVFVSVAVSIWAAFAAGAAHAGTKEKVVMTFGNFGFAGTSDPCPAGILTFNIASPAGAALGTGSSCIQAVEGCEEFAVGCHQRIEAVLSFALFGREPVIVAATLREVVLDDDPFTVAQRVRGSVVNGKGRLRGAGTIAFPAEGVESTLVYVLRLKGEG
jgi:hypothetical protein